MSVRDLHELADEYVLGLLDAAESAEVEARLQTDASLRTAIGASRDRFLDLDLAGEAPATPSPILWRNIETRLESSASDKTHEATAVAPATPVGPANDNARGWRRTALGAIAASLVMATALTMSIVNRPEPRVIAVLMNEAGEPLMLVEDFGDSSARIVPLVDLDVPDQRSVQVWTLPSREMGPVSLGILDRSETVFLDGPSLPLPQPEQFYEITLEQEGGSPTGRPTGPILAKGYAKAPR
jgi:anti-sigma-K factor RskA